MIVLLSSARTMNFDRPVPVQMTTEPKYIKDAIYLADKAKLMTYKDFEAQFKVSAAIAQRTVQQYQHFDDASTPQRGAVFAYYGSVFKAIDPYSMNADDVAFMQKHLRIASTLYGVVRPLDAIKPYRMMLKSKIFGIEAKNVHDYWYARLSQNFIDDIKQDDGILINLASLDIQTLLNMELIKTAANVITPDFKDFKNGKYETIRTYAKIARGLMTRDIMINKWENPDHLKQFNGMGYKFSEEMSRPHEYVYIR
ncbi:MAG: YaaA family protein [Marinifilaceae bacterium]